MRISCPSCQSSYKIADEKVQGRTVKVRCRKCGLTIHVNEQGVMNDAAGAVASPSAASGEPNALQFSVLVAEGDQRDMGLQDIVAAYNSGVITADTFVWSEGQPDWMPLGEVPAVIEALNVASEAVDQVSTGGPVANEPHSDPGAMAPVAGPDPMAAGPDPMAAGPDPMAAGPDPMAAGPDPMAAGPDPMAAPEAAAPAPDPFSVPEPSAGLSPQPAAASPSPLFGQPAAAAAPAASPTPLFGSSPSAAVQGSHEKKPDLFGAQAMAGTDDDVSTSAPSFGPVVTNKPTGARDESSVLFSLSALTSAAAATSSSSDGSATGDDSGLIDLRALAEKEAGAPQQAAVAAPTGGILDAAPLLGTPIMDPSLNQLKASDPPPARSNKIAIIGIAIGTIGILSAVAMVAFVLTREPELPPVPTVAATTDPEPPPVAVPIPTDTSSSAAAAPATGAPSATAAPTAAAPRTGPRPKTAATKTKTESTGAAPAATPKKPTSRCNCPPGDLACNMACAVK